MMKTVNIHEAKTQLSRLIDAAVKGEPFIIARAGKPMVKVTMIEERSPTRLGFMDGSYIIPQNFDEICADEIQEMFEARKTE